MSKSAAARADNTTIAAAPSTSPQSQLAGLTGNVATINPQGDTARFVLADIKGKDAAAAYRVSVIRTAVLELLKGNPRNLKEAAALVGQLGSAVKAKAYSAGFAVVADVQAIERTGKWTDTHNADIRTQADTLADAYALQFDSAYMAVVNATKDKAAATRAANKAAKEAAAQAAQASAPANAGSGDAESDIDSKYAADAVEMDVSSLVDTLVIAIKQGMLEQGEVAALRVALALVADTDTVEAGTLAHLLTAELPMTAQAH